MAVAGAVALTWASGPPLLRSSKVVLARPPPRLLACLGKPIWRDRSPLRTPNQIIRWHGFPQLFTGEVFIRICRPLERPNTVG